MEQETLTPNKERIQLWVDALRSGKYPQGRMALQLNGNFCCLGVACEVAKENGVDVNVQADEYGYVRYNEQSTNWPDNVRQWFGLEGHWINIDGYHTSLMKLNDDRNSFAAIADKIERTFLKS